MKSIPRRRYFIIIVLAVLAAAVSFVLCYKASQKRSQERMLGVYIVDSSRYDAGYLSVTVPSGEEPERIYTADVTQCDRTALDKHMYFVLKDPFDAREETMTVEKILHLTL